MDRAHERSTVSLGIQPPRNVVAVFDFDGTITVADSLLPFCRHAAGSFSGFAFRLLACVPALFLLALGLMKNDRAKQTVIQRFLAGKTVAELDCIANDFVKGRLGLLINPRALERIAWHHANRHEVIVLSASPEIYLRHWVKLENIPRFLGTRLAFQGQRCTGRLEGANCHGEEKVVRLRELLGPLDAQELHIYADSSSDRAVMKCATFAHWRSFDQFTGLRQHIFKLRVFLKALV